MSDKDKKIEKLKRKVKKYKLLYTMAQKDLTELVERTPSKFLSKDSEYSKPNWTQKQIEYWDKMIKESIKNTMKTNERSDEWRIEQFNRHRTPEEQVHTIQEMSDRVSDMFEDKSESEIETVGFDFPTEGKWIYESPDGGKTIYRREFGKSNKEKVYE